ncbi:Gfo/Idh/MocA family protein [Actinoplanes teichomyceticus]|uniref:Putative dehydrogenase n=1 Tax=Actinoplanes teichomyceticus TaxID=1867 RepID=A0A561WA02_ACTTI|nr:Gfo/Idh/MocA family oxidoreductase [Actinoplanes teichomyceticus]TWG20681.1 putative dehydrogenase [Actinoplanes teichomyceticus]GIF14335.1 oxidoreductase [Actinoplanes teichomyceticus]
MTPRVALIGAGGHGISHRRTLRDLAGRGVLEIAALCDRNPVDPEPGVPFFGDHREMLAAARPDAVIVCTPPHTHLPIALDCLAAGADLLLEKPPVTTLAEHDTLAAAVRERGRRCQVGFQALGSAALARLRAATAGEAEPVSAAGAWWRPDSYYRRSPWAGRQTAFDGALVNPFAHALMQALAVADGFPPVRMELERYRTRPIETDDCTFLRLTGADRRRITIAVTLASPVFVAGEIRIGDAVLEYPTDRLRMPGESSPREVPGRVGLLENLLSGAPLVAPLDRTRTFTAVAEAIAASAPPVAIPAVFLRPHPDGGGLVLPGADALVRQVAATGLLPSEHDLPWAAGPQQVIFERGATTHAQTEPR